MFVVRIKMLENHKISVIITVFNKAKFLSRCIESVINNTYKNIEIIIVDDGSTDNSCDICTKYMKDDNRILLVKQKNQGASIARNAGLNEASGYAVHFMDADDYISDNYYQTLLDDMLLKNLDIIGSRYYNEQTGYTNNDDIEIIHQGLLGKLSCNEGLMKGAAFFLFQKNFLDRHKLSFEPSLKYGEDTLFVTQALFYAARVGINLKAYYYYTYNLNSTSNARESKSKLKFIREQQLLVGQMLDDFALTKMKAPPPYGKDICKIILENKKNFARI